MILDHCLILTKRQKQCLQSIENYPVYYITEPIPFRRANHSFYTNFNYANKTFDKLLELNLIELKTMSSGLGSLKCQVVLTTLGKQYL